MNYKQYKHEVEEKLKAEQKAYDRINGFWTYLAFAMKYRKKELLFVVIILLIMWITTLIINPEMASLIKFKIIHIIK